ncbi:HAMP domain-containing sensor histidine kinase [Bacillus sp. FJAT-50079]|uniref:sensor histidine kinase n=1 Tax=Bacillus sp. FJAT-50079 TaxID=2833577 RepID=UPI001BCA1B02|nr:HAMP domain-containing sensor histidine kinase [Bacillus sp. FJAT-50079]MBS4209303.1 HAMP domain-containing histidine kinase [Bacillus sp. FJAT-50079]
MNRKTGIQKRLFFQHLLIISLTVSLLEGVFFVSIYQYYYKSTEEMLTAHAKTSANFAMRFLDISPFNIQLNLSKLLNEFMMPQAEMQIISPSGDIIVSSTGFPTNETIDTEQLRAATIEQPAAWKGRSKIADERIMATIVPLQYEDETFIYFRYVISLSLIDQLFWKLSLFAIGIGILIISLVMLFSVILAKKITTPLTNLTEASKQLAEGHFTTRINENYIGELGTLATSFNELGRSLLQHENLKNQFISSVSHELRTPLTSIKGWSETLISGSLDDMQELITGLQIITNETDRLKTMVEELLDFSQFNHQLLKIEKTTFPICTLISEVVLQFDKHCKSKQISLQVEAVPDILLYADKNRIKQVFINLIDNAIKYSDQGGNITIDGTVDQASLICKVRDTGAGINKKDLPNIMDPFYKANENVAGAGLGLAICQQIIKLHHGQLTIESEEGTGTIVTVILPL